jgi:hypothetical protein
MLDLILTKSRLNVFDLLNLSKRDEI